MREKIKKIFIDIKEEGYKHIISCIVGGLILIAAFLFFWPYNNYVNPELNIKNISVKQIENKAVLSPDNPTPPAHDAAYYDNGKLIMLNSHVAPVLQINLIGKGNIKKADIYYTLHSEEIKQSVSVKNPTFFKKNSYKLKTELNLSSEESNPEYILYLKLISEKENKPYVYVIQYKNEKKFVYILKMRLIIW